MPEEDRIISLNFETSHFPRQPDTQEFKITLMVGDLEIILSKGEFAGLAQVVGDMAKYSGRE